MLRLFRSRLAVAVVFGAALLALDVGRSIWARVALASPSAEYRPDPGQYADLTWPPGAHLGRHTSLGERVFAQRCAVCHGPDGRGNGPAAPSMSPRPRDFSSGIFKYKSTPAGEPPTDADLLRTVRDGLRASAMPYFADLLSAEELTAVVQKLKSFSTAFARPRNPIEIPAHPPSSPDSLARGKALFVSQGCAECHGGEGRGGRALDDGSGRKVFARDLTAPWTFRGGGRAGDIWLRLTTGIMPGPMPAYADALSADSRWDLANFVVSLARTPPWEKGGGFGGAGFAADLSRRGDYLTRWEVCGLCHTQIDRTGIYNVDGAFLAGGMRVGYYPYGYSVSGNLTSDPETGLGKWSAPQIVRAIRDGQAPDRALNPFAMLWPFFNNFTSEDATAIATFLKKDSRPAHNVIPPKLSYGLVETVAMKLTRPLPAAAPKALTYGDFAIDAARGSPDAVQTVLVDAQWIILALALLMFARAGRRPGIKAAIAAVIVLAGAGGLLVLLWEWPSVPGMPPDPIVKAVNAGGVTPDTRGTPVERVRMAERGHYLYSISCAICHGTDGSGGTPISWKPFGTLWTRNITSHPKAGLGAWTDRELERAIRSGVSRDGRQLHWQGMTWDQLSNLDEEDLRAVIAYVRLLPPIDRVVPLPRPPAADDCDTYTFYLGKSDQPGCR
ncbi:MAG TPA: c-type cytochrome [Roseiarcus sp.]|nr:c-type cytochrome [Roseiarcus sp.]